MVRLQSLLGIACKSTADMTVLGCTYLHQLLKSLASGMQLMAGYVAGHQPQSTCVSNNSDKGGIHSVLLVHWSLDQLSFD
eukprot:832136-Amphidinium_carterae.1